MSEAVELRGRLRAWRANLSASALETRPLELAAHLVPWLVDQRVRTVGSYMAVRGELDPEPTLAHPSLSLVEQFVPILTDDRLTFGKVTLETAWTKNRYGILEPVSDQLRSAIELDVVLVPCVAIDRVGHRLGQGGGWYDRTFASPNRSAILVGVVYDQQILDELPVEPWDVPMDVLASPTGVTVVAPRK